MKKFFFSLITAMLFSVFAYAEEPEVMGIYAWADGDSTCYKLSDVPKVTYDEGAAVLTIGGKEQLRVQLTDGAQLKITYGVYIDEPTAIEGTEQRPVQAVQQNGKYIRGGRLVIIKDGKMYDANGVKIQ